LPAVGLDFGNAWELMGRDLDEFTQEGGLGWIFLVLFFSMPLAALLLVAARRWIALIPLTGWIALNVAWFLYYATDWFGPVTGAAAGLVFLLLVGGWVLLVVAAATPRRRAATDST
jgi:hypothetical protein